MLLQQTYFFCNTLLVLNPWVLMEDTEVKYVLII